MPYVKSSVRDLMMPIIKEMDKVVCVNGDLNYILFYFCKYHITPSYANYKNYCGELQQCITEIERKIIGPYEDRKILENGDI